MSLTQAQKTDAYRFFALVFNAAPGVTYMNQIADAYAAGATTKDIVNAYTTKPQFLSVYPSFYTNEQFANKLVDSVVGDTASDAAKQQAKADIVSALNSGLSRGDVIYIVFNNLASKPETDAEWGQTAKMFANKVAVAQYVTEEKLFDSTNLSTLQSFLANVTPTTDTSTPAAIEAALANSPLNQGQTFMLTTGVDSIVGTAGDDTIVAGEGSGGGAHTLGASDLIDGKGGTDTIKITMVDGQNVAPNMQNVERMVVQTVGGNNAAETVNMINVSGIKEIVNNNSTDPLTINNLQENAKLIVNGGAGFSTRVAQSTAAARTGDLAIELNNAKINNLSVNQTGADAGGVAGNPSATIALTGTNTVTQLELGNAITTLTIKGDGSLKVTNNTGVFDEATLTKIDASANTGGVTISTNQAATGLTFLGGKGNDQITFAAGTLTAADSVNGGDGTDRIVAAQADLMAAAAKIANVENIRVSNALTGTLGADTPATNLDASKFAGATTIELAAGYAAAGARIDNLNATQQRVDILAHNAGGILEIDDGGSAATDDQFTIGVGTSGANAAVTNATVRFASGTIERINILSNGDVNTAGANVLTLDAGGVANTHTITISGDEDLILNAAPAASKIVTVDASASKGGLIMANATGASLVAFNAAQGVTIKGGQGNDVVVGGGKADVINTGAGADLVWGSAGADTITLGDGADVIKYTALAQSNSAATDTITDFVSGTDQIDLSALGVTTFVGTKADLALAQGALLGNGTVAAVFQADANRLWVDIDGNGTLDANDFRVVLQGVTNLAAGSVVTGAGLVLTATGAPFNTVTGANIQGGLTAGLGNNTIKATKAQADDNASVIDGVGGTNTLVITDDAIGLNLSDQTTPVANIATIQLAAGSTGNATMPNLVGLTVANTSANAATVTLGNVAQTYQGGTAGDDVTLGGNNQTVNTGAGGDTLQITANRTGINADLGADNDTVKITAAITAAGTTGTINGGAGTDVLNATAAANNADISGLTLNSIEDLTLANNNTISMTAAQHNGFTGTVMAAGGAETITLTTAGTVTGLTGVESYTLANGTNQITLTAFQTGVIIGGTGNDLVIATGAIADGTNGNVAGVGLAFGGGNDTLRLTAVAANLKIDGVGGGPGLVGVSNLENIEITGYTAGMVVTVVDGANGGGGININASTIAANMTLDISGLTAANGNSSVTLGSGNDTLQTGIKVAGGNTLTIDFGQGNATVANVLANAGTFIFKATNTAGATTAINFNATAADLDAGDTFDFNLDVAGIVTAGTGTARQLIVTSGANTTLLFDVDGNDIFSAGDIQITLTGQNLTAANLSIVGGNLVVI